MTASYLEMEKWESALQSRPVQEAAAEGLAVEIKRLAALLSKESFTKLMHELNRRLYEMVHGADMHEKQAAVIAIARLAEQATDETLSNLSRYANYLRTLIPGRNPVLTASSANALARLVVAATGTALAAELVEYEFSRCFEWISEHSENGTISAMLIFKEMIDLCPTLAYPFIMTLMELTWSVLLSSKSTALRQVAEDTLRALLLCFRDRSDNDSINEIIDNVAAETIEKLRDSSTVPLCAIAGIAIVTQVFPSLVRDRHFEGFMLVVLQLATLKDSAVKQAAFSLIPELASLDPKSFSDSYLEQWTQLLLEILNKKEKERIITLKAIKCTIDSLGSEILPSVDSINRSLRQLLLARSKLRSAEETEIMDCVASLARALKGDYQNSVRILLPALLAGELNSSLRSALHSIVENIPNSMPLIEDHLLGSVGRILDAESDNLASESQIVFACETLTRFNYCEPMLDTKLGDRLFGLLSSTSVSLKQAAALSLAHLSCRPRGEEFYESFPSVIKVVTLLLTLAASDPDANLCSSVLEALNADSLDFYLSSTEPFHILLMILSTGTLACRLTVVSIVERITRHNTGLIYPHFRSILLQLLADLGCPHPKSISEDAAMVLSEVARLPASLLRPAVEPLLRALSSRLLDSNPNTATAVLVTLGRLVQVNPQAFNSHVLSLVNSISKILGDQSSSKRRLAALGFLCMLLRNVNRTQIPSDRLAALLLETADLLRIELVRPVRNEAIKLIGIIGALDPYKMRAFEMEQQLFLSSAQPEFSIEEAPASDIVSTLSDDYYPSVAVSSLLKILGDASLGKLHAGAVQALLAVFQSMGVRSASYLVQVMPVICRILWQSGDRDKAIITYTLQALSALIITVGLHIRPFAIDLFSVVKELWNSRDVGMLSQHSDVALKMALLSVIKSLSDALGGETLVEIVSFVPMVVSMLSVRHAESNSELMIVTLSALHSLAGYARDHVHSIIAAINELLLETTASSEFIKRSILLVLELADCADIRLDLPLIVPLIGTALRLDGENVKTIRVADRLACYLAINFSEEFHPLRRQVPAEKLPALSRLLRHSIAQPLTGLFMIDELLLGVEDLSLSASLEQLGPRIPTATTTPVGKLAINEQNLRRSWDSFDCNSKEDWFHWIRRFEAELLKESPAPSLRACSHLALKHYPLARELFNAAFAACWNDLSDGLQDELVGALEAALASLSIPPEAMQIILGLAEFMERDDRPLPMDVATLGAYSMKCHAYAKALYYQETEFQNSPSAASVEALISVNSQIQQPDSAAGILVCAQKQHGIVLEESWYEKLQRWDDALSAYRAKWERDPQSFDALLGIFRCWHALGDWDALNSLATDVWHDVPPPVQASILPLAASAAWSIGDWTKMDEYVAKQSPNSLEGAVFRSVLAINHQVYDEAERYVTTTRELLDTELTAMLGESYSRAYNTIVRAQTLSELEEVIAFCQAGDDLKRRNIIRGFWSSRLDDCQVSVDVWQRILKIRALVTPPEEAQARWIKFATLCRRNQRPLISRRILLGLLHVDERQVDSLDLTQASPAVVYGFLKHNWELGERDVAVRYLRQYARYLAQLLDRKMAQTQLYGGTETLDLEEQTKLLARCHFKLGEWQKFISIDKGEEVNSGTIENYLAATSYDKNWYKAWHGWALVNFEMAMTHERRQSQAISYGASLGIPGQRNGRLNPYLVPAIQGFFRSIGLSDGSSLQDSLRLLTLWFKYGALAEVNAAVGDGFHSVPVDNWLQVIPQLIARIHVPSPQVRRLIHHLLSDIGKQHPQALIYPLTVASKSQSVARRTSALAILDKMRSHSARLVEQAIMVSQELIRVAILWEEMWYEGLEEASKQYFGEHNVPAMLSILEPLHQLIEKGHDTARERAFLEAYSGDLKEAREQCLRYKRTGNANDLNTAWDLYYQVFRRISKQLPQLGAIDLDSASPRLLAAGDLDIAVPGTYRAGGAVVKISSFSSTVGVISSKQRPRKLVLVGSDGQRYKYLLKGHEDLRQDERVMQLFGLVNTILEVDSETQKRHLMIERFAVIPLSQNTGLIGWVPHCDTIHSLIRDYREARGVLLSIEHRLMLQFAPDYDHLPTINKVEAFEYALGNTDGRDLGRIMWQRSLTSELWLERRLSYTRSLAVMSMVGYILGLGDRHPSNLMIDQMSGRVVHIDFGDCFEVAMQRDKFPERVPFRLTRMLVKAMEVSGIEGSFRITCEHTMRVLRGNKDSLMAVLEAFVYDPLINWRLLARPEPAKPSALTGSSGYSELSAEAGIAFPENFSSSRRVRRDAEISRLEDESINRPEAVNAGALNVINRVSNKLTGRDFRTAAPLDTAAQVDRLANEATLVDNLCQAYVGWCAFW